MRCTLAAFLLFIGYFVSAQSSVNYQFATSTNGSLTSTVNGDAISFSGSTNLFTNNATNPVNAYVPAYDFMFMGKRYNVIVVNGDGVIGLSVDGFVNTMTQTVNGLNRTVTYPPTTNTGPAIAPFWDDLKTALSGRTVVGKVVGTAPYRCVVVEWNANINQNSTSSSADGVFQLRIYESSGKIEFVYGNMQVGTSSATVSASIGFAAGNTNNTVLAVKDLSTFNITTITSEESASRSLVNTSTAGAISALNSTADGSRRIFSFTPPVCNGIISNSSVTRVMASGMQLNWTDNITNKLGYLVYRSAVDSNNYQFVTTLASSATGYAATGLSTNTRYYWKVIPYTEGNTQTVIRLSDSTRCFMNGVYTVGSGGTFTSLKAARDSANLWGLDGNTSWELLSTYSFASEALPVTLQTFPSCNVTQPSVTVRPATGASFNYTHTNTATPVFLMDNANNIILDGRAGGSGSISMTLQGDGELVKFKNTSNSILQYFDIRSSATSKTVAPVVFESGTTTGCVSNIVRGCELHNRLSNVFPAQLVLTKNTTATAVNKWSELSQNKFYNFSRFAAVVEGNGWKINDNSFFADQVISSSFDTSGIIMLSALVQDSAHYVINNYFGGTASNCGGSVMKYNFQVAYYPVQLYGNGRISGNTFRKMQIQATGPAVWSCMASLVNLNLEYFNQYIGVDQTVSNNNFGNADIADSICFINSSGTALDAYVIRNAASVSTISNNYILNIRTLQTGSDAVNLHLITNSAGATITGNTIGSNIIDYRIQNRTKGTTAGISTTNGVTVSNNIITNIAARGNLTGISGSGGAITIRNNTVSYLKVLEDNSGSWYTVAGVALFSSNNSLVEANAILHLQDSSVSGNSSYGATSFFGYGGYNTYSRNLIDGLACNSLSPMSKTTFAFRFEGENGTIENNFIRLGVDSAGNTVHTGLFGAFTNDWTSHVEFKHNTVYIGGSNVNGTGISSAMCVAWYGSTYFYNNIFVNERNYLSNGNSTIYAESSSSQNSSFNNNIVKMGTGVSLNYNNETFKQWQARGRDENSMAIDPNLLNPTGPTRTLDLHVHGTTAAESRGTTFQTSTYDYDGELRSSNSPVDIGADAGLYTRLDLEPPRFTVTPLADATDTAGRFITIRITDSTSGIRDTGSLRPKIWYRKNYPAITAWQSAYGTKQTGTAKDGTWQFYINHQLLNVSVNGNDSIQYYFVAQDTTSPAYFISTSPAAGSVHTSVNQQVLPPTTPYIYRIIVSGYIIPSVITIAPGERYTTLTGDGGLFEGITRDSVHASVTTLTVKIGAHLQESGKWSLDSVLTRKNIRLNIVPAYDSLFIISNQGNLTTDMIRFNNADKVTIDGRFNGSGRWLRFVNTHATPASAKATIALLKNTDSFVLRNTELMNNTSNFPNSGIVVINDGTSTDVEVRNNIFSNVTGGGKPSSGIQGTASGRTIRLVVAENRFINMNKAGVHFNSYSYNSRIDSNHVYWNDASPHTSTEFNAFYTGGGVVTTHQIKDNYIGGSQPYALGTPWVNNSALQQFVFIKMLTGSADQSLIQGNVIRNFTATHPNGSTFIGINTSGAAIVDGNMIGDSTVSNSLQFYGTNFTMINTSDRKQTVTNNFVGGIKVHNNTWAAPFVAIWVTGSNDSTVLIRNNTIRNITSASEAAFSSSGTFSGIYTFPGAVIEQNTISDITLTGSTAIQFYGIHLLSKKGLISRNRIYNVNMPFSVDGNIEGIHVVGGSWKIWNNQFTLVNGTNTNALNIYGINDKTTVATDTKDISFNTFLIGGTASGTAASYAVNAEGTAQAVRFRNNLVVNNRSGGTGIQGMVAVKRSTPVTYWSAIASNYNLFVTKDTSRVFLWGTSTVLGMGSWRSNTGGDANSYITPAQVLPSSQLFKDSANGNLNIDSTNSLCWYVNGKGNPIDSIDADYNQTGIRSTTAANGPVDIGSHEFTTSATPPQLFVYGRHQPGGSDTLSFNGKIVAIINWNNTGTLPTMGNAQWYSGVWPNDTTNGGTVTNARFTSSYLHIPATGGSGYGYSLVYYYDSSMMGKVTDPARLVVNKRQPGVLGSWQNIASVVNTVARTITINNQTGFSEFTAADAMAPLPVRLLRFAGAAVEKDVQLNWEVAPADEDKFVVERSVDGRTFKPVNTIAANGASDYYSTDVNILQQAYDVLYYRLKMVSKTGEVAYSKIVTIKPGNAVFVLNVTPNPFNSQISIQLKLDKPVQLRCTLTDLTGKMVYNLSIAAPKGLQNITLNQLDQLPQGNYVLQLSGGDLHYQSMMLRIGK